MIVYWKPSEGGAGLGLCFRCGAVDLRRAYQRPGSLNGAGFSGIASVLNTLILGVFIFIEMLWEVGIVGWSALQWTPFAYAHYSIPIHELSIVSLIVLTGVATALTWLGFIGFRRRSIG